MIKIVIIDDEAPARKVIEGLLVEYFPNKFNILAKCDSVDSGLLAILEHQPQLIFLDIKMNPKNGFELLKLIPNRNFEVIFTTAFDEYAIKAIRFSALDYLLKPISLPELRMAIERFEFKKKEKQPLDQIQLLLDNMQSEKCERVAFQTEKSIEVLHVADINFCKANGSYCEIHLTNKKRILVTKPLKYVEDLLSASGFIKPHKSYLVNSNSIIRFSKKEELLELNDHIKIPVSVRKKSQIIELLQQLT